MGYEKRRRAKRLLPLVPLLLLGLAHADREPDSIGNWRTASRAPVGLAPDPGVTPEPVVPSGTGGQVSVFGVLGVVAGVDEGLELNLLGLTFGVDPNDVALELPLVGTLGFGAPRPPGILRIGFGERGFPCAAVC
jgi:hypothetical protein